MKPEEAIEILELPKDPLKSGTHYHAIPSPKRISYTDYLNARKAAVEALEKQVVKPIIYRIEPLGKKRHELFYECPNCNVDLPKIIKSDYLPKYCPLCGQAIDWGGESE